MANLIDILINAKWTGGAATQQASGDVRKLGNTATSSSAEIAAANKKTGLSFGALSTSIFAVTAALATVTLAAKRLGGAIVSGAEIEATIIRFDRLADSIGTTGDALRSDLGIATQGLVSDLEAMSSATDFLALGLADTHDEAVRLTSVASQLGFNMNQLVLTLTNQTTMRFDALGVSVVGFAEKVNALEDAGLSAQEAFTEAFLQQAEEQIERVGSRAETTAGQIDMITAAWDDVKASFKEQLVGGVSGMLADFAEGQQLAIDLQIALSDLGDADGDIKGTEQAVEALRDVLERTTAYFEEPLIQGEMQNNLAQFFAVLASSGATVEEQQDILRSFGIEVDNTNVFFKDGLVILDDYRVSWLQVADAIEQVKFDELQEQGASYVRNTIEPIIQGFEDNFIATQKLKEEFADLEEKREKIRFKELLEDVNLTSEEFTKLAFSLGSVQEAIDLLTESGSPFERIRRATNQISEAIDPELLEERASLWRDFQDDLSDIAEREGERREDIEATHEERRTEIAEQFGLRRAQSEDDFIRRRERADARLQDSIDDTREDSAEREIDLRERANKRLSELERDHLDRMTDIIESADDQLIEAAGRLDASALASIQRTRERALKNEEESYEDSRAGIKRQLDEQLREEREAAAERVQELQEFHAERKRIEEEDRAIRLQREQDAQDARLTAIDDDHQARLDQIKDQGVEERAAREQEHEDLWTERLGIEIEGREALLEADRQWWKDRQDLVPTGGDDLPQIFFGPTGGVLPGGANVGGININIEGAGSPAETGDAVRDALIELFGGF